VTGSGARRHLIGHASWAQATPGWTEPPHLWLGAVGNRGTGESPGADSLLGEVLPEVERRIFADFPDRLRDWAFTGEAMRLLILIDALRSTRFRLIASDPPQIG
jgi:hypothetical protein